MSTSIGEEIFNIGSRLREERERITYSQEALGTRVGTTGRTIKKYESNETSPRAIELLQMYSLGMDVLYIVTGVRLPVGTPEVRGAHTPAETLAEFITTLKLSESDSEMLRSFASRLSGEQK